MNRILVIILVVHTAFSSCRSGRASTPPRHQVNFRQQAEWEPSAAIWMIYPKMDHKKGMPNEWVTRTIIESIAPSTTVKLVVPDTATAESIRVGLEGKSWLKERLVFFVLPYHEFWARDMGPRFVINQNGDKVIADFSFNTWGYLDVSDSAAIIDEQLDEQIALSNGISTRSSRLVSEAGGQELNSKGTIILVEAVELSRNPGWTRKQIEKEYARMLGVRNFIWLKQGLRDDDHSTNGPIEGAGGKKYYTVLTTNGHADEFVRFANDSTILLAWIPENERVSPIEKETARRMEENYSILSAARDQDGNRFRIIRFPMPFPIYSTMTPDDGVYKVLQQLKFKDPADRPSGGIIDVVAAASYLNFLIVNDIILMPTYWKEGMSESIRERDVLARKTMEGIFPGKRIIGIDALPVNWGGGGIHCITINEPSVNQQRSK